DRVTEPLAELLEHVNRQRRGAGDEQAHAARDLRRSVEQPDVDRRHAEEQRRSEIEKLVRGSPMIETLQQPHATSARQPATKTVARCVDVEQREREQEPVGCRDLPRGEQRLAIRYEVAMRQDGTL